MARCLGRAPWFTMLVSIVPILIHSVVRADYGCTAKWLPENDPDSPPDIAHHSVVNHIVLSGDPLVRRDLNGPHKSDVGSFSEAIELLKLLDDGSPGGQLKLKSYGAIRAVHQDPREDSFNPRLPPLNDPQRPNAYPEKLWGNCVHEFVSTPFAPTLFLLWHRAYVRAFEISANSVVAEKRKEKNISFEPFGIPYWNWVDFRSMPPMLRCPEADVSSCPWQPSDFNYCNEQNDDTGFLNPLYMGCRAQVTRTDEKLWTPVQGVNPISTDHSEFSRLDNELGATWHDIIHNVVGGVVNKSMGQKEGWMTSSSYAALDPAFWVHHAFVDRLMSGWVSTVASSDPIHRDDLLDQAGPGSPLEKAWKDSKAIFPVICGNEFVWYQPRFEDLAPIANSNVFDAQRLGYEYDSISLPKDYGLKKPWLRKLGSSVEAEQKGKFQEQVIVGEKNEPSRRLVTPAKGRFEFAGNLLVIRLRLKDLQIGPQLQNLLGQLRKGAISRTERERLKRRVVIVSFDGARLDVRPSPGLSYTVMARVDQRKWRYVGSLGIFGVPTTATPTLSRIGSHEDHPEHDQHGGPTIDISGLLAEWFSDSKFKIRANAVLEVAVVLTSTLPNGSLVLVPADEKPGLSFKSMTVWLKSSKESQAKVATIHTDH